MDIYAIGDRDFSVYICTSELEARQINLNSFSAEEAKRLVGDTLLGKKCGDRMKIEMFPGKDDVLLFVHLGSAEPKFISFGNGESLISALTECSADDIELLTYINNTYYLAVYPFSDEADLGRLEEFGEVLIAPPEFELYLREHGEYFLEYKEIKSLKRLFSAKKKR